MLCYSFTFLVVDLLLDSTTDPSTYYQGEYNHYIEGHQYVYPNLDVNGALVFSSFACGTDL